MNLEIKVPLRGFLIKWLEVKYGSQPFDFTANTLLAKELRFVFTGNKGHNAGNLANTEEKEDARFVLTKRQSASYKRYQSTTELKSAIIALFQSRLAEYVESQITLGHMGMIEAIRSFIFMNELDGEDITTEYCKKKVQDYRKLKKNCPTA